MELKKTFDFRRLFVILYALFFISYLVIGLQPMAEASNYEISDSIEIPSIHLYSEVTTLKLIDRKLNTPDDIVGSFSQNKNKTLLIGHVSTVFEHLNDVLVGDSIIYNSTTYTVTDTNTLPKTNIKMNELLASSEKPTIVIMTCAGDFISQYDTTHRLIVTAQAE